MTTEERITSRGAALAEEALRLALSDPASAVVQSGRAELVALAEGDWASVSRARRAAGVANLQLRRLDEAEERLRAATEAAIEAGDRQLSGEARMSLAPVLMLRGRPGEAFDSIATALTEVSGVAAARVRIQRAALLQDLGRTDEALTDTRLALPQLRRAGDTRWEAQALSNRSLMFSGRRQFRAAEADLVRAKTLCDEHGLDLQSAYIEQNLGCVVADRGEVPAALAHFDAAAERYRALGIRVGSLFVDRATVLLSVRLVAEARSAAEEAVEIFLAQGRELNVPQARLLVSTAALLQHDLAAAVGAARASVADFARLQRTEWLALAECALLQAEYQVLNEAGGSVGRVADIEAAERLLARLRGSATASERVGWVVSAQEVRLLAARLALDLGRPEVARAELTATAHLRRSGPADVRARAWLGEALLRRDQGARQGAKAALRAGLGVLEEFSSTLGASELRAQVSVHRGALARTGLSMAIEDRDARAVHWWSEQGRTRALELRGARPPQDPELLLDLQDLRTTVAEIDAARGSGHSARDLIERQIDLEHRIRDRTRHLGPMLGTRWRRPPSVGEVSACLDGGVDECVLVEFVESDGALSAVTITDGTARLRSLGSAEPVRAAMQHLPFALHRLADPLTRPRQLVAAQAVLDRSAQALDAALMAPLGGWLGDRSLVLVPAGWLQSVPWSVLPSCAGRPISVAPSTALWQAAVLRSPPSTGRVAVVAGPRLSGASAEAEQIGNLYQSSDRSAQLLTGAEAVAARVGPALDGARIAHLAAHGLVRADNPLFSAIMLADGPYTVHDLEGLNATPHHVVLAACNTALAHGVAGAELLGLSAALLTQQTSTLVAPVLPIADAETVELMTGYHRLLRAGHSPAAALSSQQQRQRTEGPRARASAAGFVCLGAGHRAHPDPGSAAPVAQAPTKVIRSARVTRSGCA